MFRVFFFCVGWSAVTLTLAADEPSAPQRCELLPLPEHQVSFNIDGVEKTRWHFGPEYPRPFFYPLAGPAGVSLTRMGHPGAGNHDHHRSVWFAHQSVNGHNFWSDGNGTQVRQRLWYAYRDSDEAAMMAVGCGWFDAGGRQVLEQELVAALLPLSDGEYALEFQITIRPAPDGEKVVLGKTNFGFLAVRVAKSVSAFFGQGKLTSSEGGQGERAIFGKTARWVDYSGPVAVGRGTARRSVIEGITYLDHPENPRYPTHWHVREDGWMGASFCMQQDFTATQARPLILRYLLYVHTGPYNHATAQAQQAAFARRTGFQVTKSTQRHQQYEVSRNRRR